MNLAKVWKHVTSLTPVLTDFGGRDRRIWISGKDGAFYWESSVKAMVCKDGYEEVDI